MDPIPREELEPFTSPEKNITDIDQRRYAAIQSEIGDEPLVGDVLSDMEQELLNSRVNSRSGSLFRKTALPIAFGLGGIAAQNPELPEKVLQSTENTPPDVQGAITGIAAGIGLLVYGTIQHSVGHDKFNDFVDRFDEFDEYRLLNEYSVGGFDTIDEVEDLLWDAGMVSYDIGIDSIDEKLDYDGLMADNDEAVNAYREVLSELEEIHRDGVDPRTAEGVEMYGESFLEPFYDEDAGERASEIQSSGAAQVIRTRPVEKIGDSNPILHSDNVFRLEIIYNQKTVAAFNGTCTSEYLEIGEPLLEEKPSKHTSGAHRNSFKEGVGKFEQISEDLGIEREVEDYKTGLFSPGGIPLHLRDGAITSGNAAVWAGKGTFNTAKKFLKSIDYRQTDK